MSEYDTILVELIKKGMSIQRKVMNNIPIKWRNFQLENTAIAAITASSKSSSAENAMKCSEGSTGTIEELNLSSGAASAGLNPQDWNSTPEPSTSWSFRMQSSKQSTRCLETKVVIRHNYNSTLPQSSKIRRSFLSRTSIKS